jgi:hypothetical protein
MENLEFTIEQVYQEVVDRMESEGAFSPEARLELINEVLDEKRQDGVWPDDFDVKSIQEQLMTLLEQRSSDIGANT